MGATNCMSALENIKEKFKDKKLQFILTFKHTNDKLIDFDFNVIKKYLDETLFKQFKIVDGNLNWNDYDLIFPIYDLYQGKI